MPKTHATFLITCDNECGKPEPAPTFHNLPDAIDTDKLVNNLTFTAIAKCCSHYLISILERQTAGARRFRKRLYPAMKEVTSTVKNDFAYTD